MQYNANKYVRVSDISAYLYCPRVVYFRSGEKESKPGYAEIRSSIYKLISSSLSRVLKSPEPARELGGLIDSVCEDAVTIYGPGAKEEIGQVRSEVMKHVDGIIAGLSMEAGELGESLLLQLLTPVSDRNRIYSERLRLAGSIDRIAMNNGKRVPVVISASYPPEHGVYFPDRIKLAAYALLLSEKYGIDIRSGAVEYMQGWRIRPTVIRAGDISTMLNIRNRVMRVYSGDMPSKNRGTWCNKCDYKGSCNVRMAFLDTLLGGKGGN